MNKMIKRCMKTVSCIILAIIITLTNGNVVMHSSNVPVVHAASSVVERAISWAM